MKEIECEHVNAKALRFTTLSFVNASTHTCNDNASFSLVPLQETPHSLAEYI